MVGRHDDENTNDDDDDDDGDVDVREAGGDRADRREGWKVFRQGACYRCAARSVLSSSCCSCCQKYYLKRFLWQHGLVKESTVPTTTERTRTDPAGGTD